MQPRPSDPTWVRYAPDITFPPYRHVPGETPHPHKHLDGHGFSFEMAHHADWHENRAYLLGVDLYNFSYWWEAHEIWESLWRCNDTGSTSAIFIQGLIQLAAALIKWHQRNPRGFRRLSERGLAKISEVEACCDGVYMGLLLPRFSASWQAFCKTPPEGATLSRLQIPLLRLELDK